MDNCKLDKNLASSEMMEFLNSELAFADEESAILELIINSFESKSYMRSHNLSLCLKKGFIVPAIKLSHCSNKSILDTSIMGNTL